MAHASNFTLALLFSLSLSISLLVYSGIASPSSDNYVGFSLAHRDAKGSPLRSAEADPADLPEDMPLRAFVAVGRAMTARLNKKRNLKQGGHIFQGDVSYAGEPAGEFFLTLPVGTPSQKLVFLVDTGSEFIWTQCSPCPNCTATKAPRFAHKKSSSYRVIRCGSRLCKGDMQLPRCKVATAGQRRARCSFTVMYGDKSRDSGFYSVDSFNLGGPKLSKPFVFGCAVDVQTTAPTPSSGILGLDRGPYSFTSQLFSGSPGMPKKFAYCLPDRLTDAVGRLEFGNYKPPTGIRYTPLAQPSSIASALGRKFYVVELQGITVGKTLIRVEMQGAAERSSKDKGEFTVVDSGSEITLLAEPLFHKLVGEVRRQTTHIGPSFNGSERLGWDLCYKISAKAENLPNMPKISMHFLGGVDVELGPGSILLGAGLDNDKAYVDFCLAFRSSSSYLDSSYYPIKHIIGNHQQQNYWFEYNLDKSRLGIATASNCAHSK